MPARFVAEVSGHSTRVGAAQDLAELDIDLAAPQAATKRSLIKGEGTMAGFRANLPSDPPGCRFGDEMARDRIFLGD